MSHLTYYVSSCSDNDNSSQGPFYMFQSDANGAFVHCLSDEQRFNMIIDVNRENLQTFSSSPPSSLTSHCDQTFRLNLASPSTARQIRYGAAGYLRVWRRLSPEVHASPRTLPRRAPSWSYGEGTYIL